MDKSIEMKVEEHFDRLSRSLSDEAYVELCDALADYFQTCSTAKREEIDGEAGDL